MGSCVLQGLQLVHFRLFLLNLVEVVVEVVLEVVVEYLLRCRSRQRFLRDSKSSKVDLQEVEILQVERKVVE